MGWLQGPRGLGLAQSSQPKGQYLGHALGKLETRGRTAHKWSKSAKIKKDLDRMSHIAT